jgi:hypothetical protein
LDGIEVMTVVDIVETVLITNMVIWCQLFAWDLTGWARGLERLMKQQYSVT